MSKLHSGTSKTKAGALFWKSHCAICSPVYVILYHVTGSCKGPIEHSRCFFICFIIRNPIILYAFGLIFKPNFMFHKPVKVVSAVYCFLIKQAKISQSQSLLELFKQFDWLTKQQLSITSCTSAELSVSSTCSFKQLSREEQCLQSSLLVNLL